MKMTEDFVKDLNHNLDQAFKYVSLAYSETKKESPDLSLVLSFVGEVHFLISGAIGMVRSIEN